MNLNTLNDNYIYKYLSSTSEVRGIVHISHGKAEHIGRYKWLISMLNDDGYHDISHLSIQVSICLNVYDSLSQLYHQST